MLAELGMGFDGNLLLFSHGNDDLPTNHFWNRRRENVTQENKMWKVIHFDLRNSSPLRRIYQHLKYTSIKTRCLEDV